MYLFELCIFASNGKQESSSADRSLQCQTPVITHLTHSWCLEKRHSLQGADALAGDVSKRQPLHFFLLTWERHDESVWERGVFDSTSMSLGVDYGDYSPAGNNPGGSVGSPCITCSHQAIVGVSQVCVAH